MNPLTDFIFTVSWFALLVFAVRSILRGWSTTPRRVHPEMVDVEPGEKLMGVTFEKKDSCDLEEYKALQQRIDEIRAELEDDEDDDGDIIVRV